MSKVLVCQYHIVFDKSASPAYQYSFESVQNYCKTWGFDYHNEFYTKDEYIPYALNHHYFERYKFIEKLEEYDHVLCLDTDILIRKNSPNIIDEYKDSHGFGINYSLVNNYLNIEPYRFSRPINCCVMLFNRKTARNNLPLHKWPTSYHNRTPWYKSLNNYSSLRYRWNNKYFEYDTDEALISRLIPIMQIPTFHIDYKWATQSTGAPIEKLKNSYFLHYGMPEGKKQLIEDYKNLIME
jgi:hypothetical protein